jgi:hypothetical protein
MIQGPIELVVTTSPVSVIKQSHNVQKEHHYSGIFEKEQISQVFQGAICQKYTHRSSGSNNKPNDPAFIMSDGTRRTPDTIAPRSYQRACRTGLIAFAAVPNKSQCPCKTTLIIVKLLQPSEDNPEKDQ